MPHERPAMTPKTQQGEAPEDAGPLLDDEGRAMVGASHHYTAENISSLVRKLKRLEDPQQSTQADWDGLDWRSFCGSLWRIISGLACDVPLARDEFGASAPVQEGREPVPSGEPPAKLCEQFAYDFTSMPPTNDFERGVQTACAQLADAFRRGWGYRDGTPPSPQPPMAEE